MPTLFVAKKKKNTKLTKLCKQKQKDPHKRILRQDHCDVYYRNGQSYDRMI